MKFTIGYIDHDSFVHNHYLGKCLKDLQGEFSVITTSDKKYPAENYNDMIEECKTPYLILTHQDVIFPPNLLECIENTILVDPNFGAIGMVGVDNKGAYRWSKSPVIYELDTLDCCFIVINTASPIRFNQEVFNEYHLYVEDYCAQQKALGRKIYTIAVPVGSKMDHYGATFNKLGPAWGRYRQFKAIFNKMWPRLKTT